MTPMLAYRVKLPMPAHRPDCKHPDGPLHDCDYVDARGASLDLASAIADAECGEAAPEGAPAADAARWSRRWDATFLRESEALYRAAADGGVLGVAA